MTNIQVTSSKEYGMSNKKGLSRQQINWTRSSETRSSEEPSTYVDEERTETSSRTDTTREREREREREEEENETETEKDK